MEFQAARDRVWRELANEASRDRLRRLIRLVNDAGSAAERPVPAADWSWHRRDRLLRAGLICDTGSETTKHVVPGTPLVAAFLGWLTREFVPPALAAFGSPTNRQILDALLSGDSTVAALQKSTSRSAAAVHHALTALWQLELVQKVHSDGRAKVWALRQTTSIVDLLNGGDLLAARAVPAVVSEAQQALIQRVRWPLWTAAHVVSKRSILVSANGPDATDRAWHELRRAYAERHQAPSEALLRRVGRRADLDRLSSSDATYFLRQWELVGQEALLALSDQPGPQQLRPESEQFRDAVRHGVSAVLADPAARAWGRANWVTLATLLTPQQRPSFLFGSLWMQLPAVAWVSGAGSAHPATFESPANRLVIDTDWPPLQEQLERLADHSGARQLVLDHLARRLVGFITTAELYAAAYDLGPAELSSAELTHAALGNPTDQAELSRRLTVRTRWAPNSPDTSGDGPAHPASTESSA